MTEASANPEAVSDERLKEMLLDGLQNHPVSSEELLTRICENRFTEKSDDFPISDHFLTILFRYLLFSDKPNQLKHIIAILKIGDKVTGRKARLALPVFADKSWYQAILDAWTGGDNQFQRQIERAFGLPPKEGRGEFKRALSQCLDTVEVNKRLQNLLRRPIFTPGQSCYLHMPDMFESILDMSYSEDTGPRHIALVIMANYQNSLIEDRAVEIILDRHGESESMRINAFLALMTQNPEKCIDYLWCEMAREECDIDAKLVLNVVAMLLAYMSMDTRYRWLCAAMNSPNVAILRMVATASTLLEPGERWVEPMLNTLAKESLREVMDSILFALKNTHDQRIADFFLKSLKHEFQYSYFQFMCDHYPDLLTEELILSGLKQVDWETRVVAIRNIGQFHDSKWVSVLKNYCDDFADDVRAASIRELAKYDDDSVFPILTLALLDCHYSVTGTAQDILETEDLHPTLARMKRRGIDVISEAEKINGQLQSIIDWGKSFGKNVLGINTKIARLTEGLGRTSMRPWSGVAEIEVTFDPVAYQHKNGSYIVEALILHEIGHHLYDNLRTRGLKSIMGQVKAEGLDELFSILQDERLERRLRSFWPEFQPHIDRLNSYAFAEQTTDMPLFAYAEAVGTDEESLKKRIVSGEIAGVLRAPNAGDGEQQVKLKPVDLMMLPGVMPPLQAFLLCLIGGFSPDLYHDQRVAEALKLLPSNFKDLNHAGMLKVARSIRHLLDIPEQGRQTKQHAERQAPNGYQGSPGRPGLSPQAAQALAGALQQIMERIKRLHVRIEPMASGAQVPVELLEAAERGEFSLPGSGEAKQNKKAGGDRQTLPGSKGLNLAQNADFDEVAVQAHYEFDSKAHADLVIPIRPHIRTLRAYFEQLGLQTTEETGVQQGRRLDAGRARMLPVTGNPNVMIRRYDVEMANAYIGILIDKSGSMDGENMERAKSFATLISESAKGIRGLAGDIGAFDHDTYYHLGNLQHCAISSLEAGGANNDAGGLVRAAERALTSGKQHKLLIMISDGLPTHCSVEALASLVQRLQHDYGIISVQVAVDHHIEHEAFPDFVDLTAYDFHEAVARFGQMVRQHIRHWH